MCERICKFVCCMLFSLIYCFGLQCFAYSDKVCSIADEKISTRQMENVFEYYLSFLDKDISFAQVPRGLVVSINSNLFFEENSIKLKDYSKLVLDMMGVLLKYFDKQCVVEGSANLAELENDVYKTSLEFSTAQADQIVDYLIKSSAIEPEKIRSIGFGEKIPYEMYSNAKNINTKRIDFVVINYEEFKQ